MARRIRLCDDGFASFELLRGRRHDRVVAPCALYLLEFNGRDLRSTPLEQRKRALAGLMGRRRPAAIEAKPRLECAFAGGGSWPRKRQQYRLRRRPSPPIRSADECHA